MSVLKYKSDINFISAELLHKETYYSSSVHCSYYSCVQLMMHVIFHILGYTKERLRADFDKYRLANNGKGGLHEYYINLVNSHLASNNLDVYTFNKEIFKLKRVRTDADYYDIAISYDEGRFAIQRADSINKIIRKAI